MSSPRQSRENPWQITLSQQPARCVANKCKYPRVSSVRGIPTTSLSRQSPRHPLCNLAATAKTPHSSPRCLDIIFCGERAKSVGFSTSTVFISSNVSLLGLVAMTGSLFRTILLRLNLLIVLIISEGHLAEFQQRIVAFLLLRRGCRGDGGATVSKGKWSVSHAHSTRGVFAFVSHATSGLLTKSYLPGVLSTLPWGAHVNILLCIYLYHIPI